MQNTPIKFMKGVKMTKRRISMRKIKEVLRLIKDCKVSQAQTAQICKISRASIQEYLMRFKASGLNWPLSETINEIELENRLFPRDKRQGVKRPEPDYNYLIQEIRRQNVTMALLWEEYKQNHPDGYQYSQFCNLFKTYSKKMNYSMRQEHKAGEKTFVDFGEGLSFIDKKTGLKTGTKIFVSVWGASKYTFVQATTGEDLHSWIKVNVDALEYFGGCSKAIVPDNLKSAVTKACKYEPTINPTYADFAKHYNTVIFPARTYRPKDKSLAENGVLLAKRWILAKLRNNIFYSLAEINDAIAELLEQFNDKKMKRLGKSRRELFEALDKPQLMPLPDNRYEFAEWKKARVNINYHILYDKHNYSVPYTYVHKEVEVRATVNSIEIYLKGERICSHRRSYKQHAYTTIKEHMLPSHQKYAEWTPERILQWAQKYGDAVKEIAQQVMDARKFPEQAYKSCLGIIRLGKRYESDRLNNACQRALNYRTCSYQAINNILEKGLDNQTETTETSITMNIDHENIRGAEYYQQEEIADLAPVFSKN